MKKLICILLLAGISCASSQRIERQECQSAPEQTESAGREDGLKTGLAIGIPAGMVLYYLIWIAL